MRMLRALDEFARRLPTLLGFHRALLEHPCFVAARRATGSSSPPSWRSRPLRCTKEVVADSNYRRTAASGRGRPRSRSAAAVTT